MVLSALKRLFGGGGTRVNVKERFEIKGKSGMGSMSQVFRAFDKKLGKQVALKLLDKEKTAAFEARFVGLNKPSEGAISVELHHPNIVETFEHGQTTGGEDCLIMEWVDGSGLHALIEAGSAHLDGQRLHILGRVADALEHLHQQKFLHRDICPRNIILTADGTVKLIDFGLALPYRPEFCKPGNRTGTPQYLAPEVIKRAPTDHRVDLFALGVTAYEMFTGQLPWGEFTSAQAQMSAMAAKPGVDPREHVPAMPEATAAWLMKAIERDPARRFPTAAAFRDSLKKLPPS